MKIKIERIIESHAINGDRLGLVLEESHFDDVIDEIITEIIESNKCVCGPDSTGTTTFECCNICGKIVEEEMKPKN